MIIGVDARAASEVEAGRGRLVRELLTALARLDHEHRFLLYCRRPADGLELDERFRWQPLPAPDPVWHAVAAAAASRASDAFLSTNSYLTAWLLRVPSAVVVCDLVAFRAGSRAQRRALLIERATLGGAVRRAGRLVCISHATERDLVARFPAAAGKSVVAHLAASARFRPDHDPVRVEEVRRRFRLEKPFVLATGTLEPRKNLARLIEAYAGLPAPVRARHELVLAGPKGWEMEETLERAKAHPGDVRLLGFVPDDDLAVLYALCRVFSYVSLYEGFGLPLLEALQSGAPAITSNVSSLPEVAGDAARYVDPTTVAEIRAALAELLESEDERERLRERGLRQAAGFSWEKTARVILDAVTSAAADERGRATPGRSSRASRAPSRST